MIVDMNQHSNKHIPLWINFVIGGCSGSLSTTIIQPADLVKTRMQLLGPKGNMSGLAMARGIVHRKGLKGLYAGFSAALLRQILYSGGRLGGFNAALEIYKEKYKTAPNFGLKVVLGMTSGGLATLISIPAEVALIRMTADGRLPFAKRRNYKHVFDALLRMVREEGQASLTRGFFATLTRAMIVNGAQLAAYAQFREALLLNTLEEGITLHFTASMLAGFFTTLISQPIDMIKTRIQNSKRNETQLGVLRNIIRTQGVLALWAGFLPAYLKIGPHTVFTFIFLEQLSAYYLRHFAVD